jgi:hypothetical protein
LVDISKDKVEREYVPYDDFKIKWLQLQGPSAYVQRLVKC